MLHDFIELHMNFYKYSILHFDTLILKKKCGKTDVRRLVEGHLRLEWKGHRWWVNKLKDDIRKDFDITENHGIML